MTGNNKFWRASLAGLASVAMLATMGVSAANAATSAVASTDSFTGAVGKVRSNTGANGYVVNVYDANKPYQLVNSAAKFTRSYGEVVTAADISSLKDGQVLDYLSYDQAGAEKVATPYVVTGDVKVYAHYKDAVTVTFDVKNDTPEGKTNDDVKIKIAKGTALTAAEYQLSGAETAVTNPDPAKFSAFAGWTTEYTKDASTSDALYTDAVLTADTTLYPRWDSGDDLSKVVFRNASETTAKYTAYTLNNKPFPAFRAPAAAGVWQTALEGSAYDFATPVPNKYSDPAKADLELVDSVAGSEQNVTVDFDYDYDSSIQTTTFADGKNHTVATTAASTIAEPVAPVKANAVFTGWYTTDPKTDKQAKKYDFSKSVAGNFANPTGTVKVYAGWDYDNVSLFVFNVNYSGWASAQQVWAVYTGKSYDLPKLWEYYQTEAQDNAAKGEFTSRNVTKWTWGADKVTKATAVNNKSVNVFDANWDGNVSVKLDANGGKFGSDTTKWVTKTSAQKWADVVVTPTRDGYTFTGWADRASGNAGITANLVDGNWYYSNGSVKGAIADTDTLYAQWKLTSTIDIAGLRDRFFTKHTAADRTEAIKTVANYGYTEDSAAKYVDAVNALEDEYNVYVKETNADKKAAKAEALAPKYQAAEALLVKSDVPVEPAPAEKVAVYRLYNPGLPQVAQHLYTSNVAEYNDLVTNHGWKGEGIVFYTTSDKTAKTVWRVYNPFTSEHFLTSDKAEYEDLYQNKGWSDDGPAWYIPADGDADVYRLRNAATGEHLYTVNAAEKDNLVDNAGWTLEGVQYKVYAK